MPGISSMFDISRWALQVNTNQLNVSSHNIANVNTEGYSRQRAVQTTRNPEWTYEGMYGMGSVIGSVIAAVDPYLNQRITDKLTDQEYASARLDMLNRMEAIANEAGETGLGEDLTALFNAWQDVSNNPESSAVREVLLETAANFADRLHTLGNDLAEMQRDATSYLSEAVGQVNDICKRIAELNTLILANERTGKPANDYRDERQRQVNELSELMNIEWFEVDSGAMSVVGPMGKTLVQDSWPEANVDGPLSLEQAMDEDGNYYDYEQIVWTPGNLVIDGDELTSGKMGAWLQVRDDDIPRAMHFFNRLAQSVIGQVNKIHSQGVGLDKYSSTTGTYGCTSSTVVLSDDANSDLVYRDLIEAGSFDVWTYTDGTRTKTTITVDPTSDTLQSIQNKINHATAGVPGVTAQITSDNELTMVANSGVEFAFANDTSGLLAALGVNTFFDGSTATNISVNSALTENNRLVAAGRLMDDGEHALGDNQNALDIADLKDALTMETVSGQEPLGEISINWDSGEETFNEAIMSWAASLGADVAYAQSSLEFAEVTNNELQNLRDSVSGVNLDEEMVKVIQFQRGYQMAAQMISVADELLLALIQIR